jgi:hypothetical protein
VIAWARGVLCRMALIQHRWEPHGWVSWTWNLGAGRVTKRRWRCSNCGEVWMPSSPLRPIDDSEI